jgi:hypothetical protein
MAPPYCHSISIPAPADTTQWNHYAFTNDGAGNYQLAINGVVTAIPFAFGNLGPSPFTTLDLGRDYNHTYFTNYAAGTYDELAIWNTALTAAEIRRVYEVQNKSKSGRFTSRVFDALIPAQTWSSISWAPTLPFNKELPDFTAGSVQNETSTNYSSLVGANGATGANNLMTGNIGLWHFNEPLGTSGAGNFIDDSGQGNHGTPTNVVFDTPGAFATAGSFNGASSVITIDNPGAFTIANPTVSAWFKTTATSGVIFEKQSDDRGGWLAYALFLTGAGKIYARVQQSVGPTFLDTTSLSTVNDGAWHHVALTFGTDFISRLYVDGVLEASSAAGGPIYYDSNLKRAAIGNDIYVCCGGGTAAWFDGKIDEVAVWNRSLHANEVHQLYRRGANRIKYQVRVCGTVNLGLTDCTDDPTGANWKGPDGTNLTYFSELNNNSVALDGTGNVKPGLPSMLFTDFTNPIGTSRYFQYRAIFESRDSGTACDYGSGPVACSPELKSVTIGPDHYATSSPSVVGKSGVDATSLIAFTETLGAGLCPSGVGYNLGVGSDHTSATWYWWDATKAADCLLPGTGAWCPSNGTATESSSAAALSANVSSFISQAGAGTVYFKSYLKSSGSSKCELDALELSFH